MSDNLRRYRAIRDALTQGYPSQPTGRVYRHLTTLAALISGIVGSKSTQLPSVATKIPDGTKPESRVKRLTRWLDNERILEEVYFLPYVDILLTQLAIETLVVVMDGSVVGRGCLALMLHVVYKGRALPLAWPAPKSQRALSRRPPHCRGRTDEHSDSRRDQGGLSGGRRVGWDGAAGHTARDGVVLRLPDGHEHDSDVGGESFRLDALGTCIQPGKLIELKEVYLTREAYGPIMVLFVGQGVSRAAVSGQQSGDSRGGMSLVSQALPIEIV